MSETVWGASFFGLLAVVVGATAWWFLRGQRDVAERVMRRRSDVRFCQEAIHSSKQFQQWAPVEGTSCVVVVSDVALEVLNAFGRPRYRYTWAEVRSATETDVRRGVVDVAGVEVRVTNRWEDPVQLTFSRDAAFSGNAAIARDFVAAIAAARRALPSPSTGGSEGPRGS